MNKKAGLILLAVILLGYAAIRAQRQQDDHQIQSYALSGARFGDEPEQTDTNKPGFKFKGFHVQPLAGFMIRARVLSRSDYYVGTESGLSPMDLALGCKRMADPEIYGALNISQRGRWYYYSWKNEPPIPLPEIVASSANMHLIPASPAVERSLEQASEGRFVKIKGWLVEVRREDGWHWRSSLSRTDSGGGSCELIFVEAAEIE